MTRGRILLLGIIGLIVVVAATSPLWLPYFTTVEVNEEFPIVTTEEAVTASDTDAESETTDETSEDEAEAVALRSGTWIELDPVHGAEGSATIYQLGDERVVRLDQFRVTNGPDLYVVLAKNVPTGILGGVGEDYINLGALKGNVGSQNYTIPAEVNIDEYGSVVIYCLQFNVVFSSAALS
jgi:hypothetical protein